MNSGPLPIVQDESISPSCDKANFCSLNCNEKRHHFVGFNEQKFTHPVGQEITIISFHHLQ